MFVTKGYCRYGGVKCIHFKLNRKNPHRAYCKKGRIISSTIPISGNIKAPDWCHKKH